MSTRISHLYMSYTEHPKEGASQVSLHFQVPGEINFDTASLRQALDNYFDGVFVGMSAGNHGRPIEEAETEESERLAATVEPEPPKTKRKRRTKAEMEAAREAVAEDQAVEAHEASEQADADPTPAASGRRRRGRSSPATSESSDDGASSEPTTRRRRRRAAVTDLAGNSEANEPPTRRRGRRLPTADDAGPVSAEITDLDLSKAASQAAVELTPKGVFNILDQFGADTAKDVPPENRAAFLAQLAEAVAEVK